MEFDIADDAMAALVAKVSRFPTGKPEDAWAKTLAQSTVSS